MAPQHERTVATVLSAQVLSHDEGSVLVEAGGFTPMRWFLEHGLRPNDEDGEPPTKRRKTEMSGEQTSVRAVAPSDGNHIPIARLTIDLHFPETLSTKPSKAQTIEQDVEFDSDAESISVVPSVIDLFDDGTRLRLALPRKKGAIIMVDVADMPERVLDTLRKVAVTRSRKVDDAKAQKIEPASWVGCTLTRSQGQLFTVVRFEASIYWPSGASAFPAPAGVPVAKARIYPDYDLLVDTFPNTAREEVDHTQPWTPQDFYDSVHVPEKSLDTRGHFNTVLESELYPFQKRAVHWMLEREGVRYVDGVVQPLLRPHWPREVQFHEEVKDVKGNACYVNHLQGVIQRSESSSSVGQLSGGLLAEEMGLGKTVEVMALLCLHRRPENGPEPMLDLDAGIKLTPSKATLIITPATILQQWKSELVRHAPALKVLHYEGISARKSKEEKQLISDMTSQYDIVLATYSTLSKEVHFAEDPPDRNMRQAPKFKRKRSPLVRIQWWRICLDEAQMVESGVTAAARVACRLPRVHSWAVSGTPLRKNVQDLHGLLIFLGYKPFSDDAKLWSHLITNHRHLFRRIFGSIALRHTKAQIREDLHLPPQKRVVITVPFSAIEQQRYSTLFSEMCEEVGVSNDGSPLDDSWDPEHPPTVEAMRSFLTRLRQTCLHPQVGGKNRKALGRGQGPLRTVAEVLEVMIDQNETDVRTEERALLATQLVRAHILGNARDDEHRSAKALEIYLDAVKTSGKFVKDARQRLAAAKEAQGEKVADHVETDDEEDSSTESTPLLGRLRNSIRMALQLEHDCMFFAATAYFQIKTNITLTEPDSDNFKQLEERETRLYENAKLRRREILKDSSRKAESLIRRIKEMTKNGNLTKIPPIKDLDFLGGIESRRIVDKSDRLFDTVREQAQVIMELREKMPDYLLKPLVDEDDGIETTGDEYEDSTKLQDELYAYFDAIKWAQADLNFFVTGETTPLIDHEIKTATVAAKNFLNKDVPDDVKQNVHAPELTLRFCAVRKTFSDRKKEVGSIKALIQEARGVETSLQGSEGSIRAAERTMIREHLTALQSVVNSYSKVLFGLEKEVDLFRSAQSSRIEFYRQLQECSDNVKPHKEELDETLDVNGLNNVLQREDEQSQRLAKLRTQNRYLISLRDEAGAQAGPRICVICQYPFEQGVLTVCGHQYCKECIQHWWSEKKTCPMCKRGLTSSDFHNITYKPHELRAQEEVQSGFSSPAEATPSPSRSTSIYSDVDSQLMQEIKSIDLPASYGTKIDTLGRHLMWIREHDPGAKSIVFSQFREFLDVLGTALRDFKIGYCRLGRAGAPDKFKHDPSVDCLLLDAKTDSSGLTLVNATHVFICEPLIQTAVELQAIARVHRIGQTRPTTVWMYLINDTVEEAIYEISVARRLAHVQSRQSHGAQKSRSATPALQENAIDAANSEEMQSAPISKLLQGGKGGGELVGNGDLWQCLFGKSQQATAKPSVETELVVGRHLRAEAAEARRLYATASAQS